MSGTSHALALADGTSVGTPTDVSATGRLPAKDRPSTLPGHEENDGGGAVTTPALKRPPVRIVPQVEDLRSIIEHALGEVADKSGKVARLLEGRHYRDAALLCRAVSNDLAQIAATIRIVQAIEQPPEG